MMKVPRSVVSTLALLGLGSVFSGCSTVSYLLQAGQGQLELFNRAEPLEQVLARETTPPRLKRLLSRVPGVKSFGERYGLKPTSNYSEYVALDRPSVVTVIAACSELEFTPQLWRFPIVGSFPYLGFFNERMARDWAADFRKKGFDVEIRGASAYSTLGWFRDPILSSMIPEGDEALGELVDVILHESVHASHYIDHQSYFNESMAAFLAEGLAPLYLRHALGPDSGEERAYLADIARDKNTHRGLHQAYTELEQVYRSSLSLEEKRIRKGQVLKRTREALGLRREINNATLIQFKTYRSGVEAFEKLHARCGQDWSRTVAALFRLKETDFPARQTEEIEPVLAKASCP